MASELLSFGILSLCVGKCVKIAAALYLLSRVYHKYMAVWRSLESAYDYRTNNAGICLPRITIQAPYTISLSSLVVMSTLYW